MNGYTLRCLLWTLIVGFGLGCTSTEIPENDARFIPCTEVAVCPEDTFCFYGLCQPLVLCETDQDCARSQPGVCNDCDSWSTCQELHADGGCLPPRLCVELEEDGVKVCDQSGVGCEMAADAYYCSRVENRICITAGDDARGSGKIFYCGATSD